MATITARVDQTDKENFIAFCTNAGLNASTAINMFVKAVLRENRIPFKISDIPNDDTIAALLESERLLADPNTKYYTSVEELFEALES